jgi:competence protein ComEC
MIALVAANAWFWTDLAARDSDTLQVTFLDVGQGDATLIETPDGQTVLIDTGPDPARLVREIDEQVGLGRRRIDLLLLTHVDADHVTGALAALRRYDVRQVAWTGHRGGLIGVWTDALERDGVSTWLIQSGDRLQLAGGVTLDVLWPSRSDRNLTDNAASIVLLLRHGDVRVVLTGDAEASTEVALLQAGIDLHAGVLKVGHHGSATSSLPEFLTATGADFAVIPVGATNQFGHPSPIVLERLENEGMRILRTDIDGTITFNSDGEAIWLD